MSPAPRYSFIIPHYNIPELLERCLGSIPEREDVEVLVVDDCSPTDCREKLQQLEQRFPHVTFLNTGKNGGAGRARNIGLEHAKGDYLIFADADDFFTEQLPSVLDEYVNADYDVIYFRNICVSSEDPSQLLDRTKGFDDIFDRYLETGDESEVRCLIHNPWAKFFRRKMVREHGFRFDETPFSNDIFFVVSCGCGADLVKVDQRIIYAYSERPGSLSSSFMRKSGELGIRAAACFRAQKIIFERGFRFHFMPMTLFLSEMLHNDRKLYRKYIKLSPEVYESRKDAIRQVRWWENGLAWKLWAYVYSFICLLLP